MQLKCNKCIYVYFVPQKITFKSTDEDNEDLKTF